MNTITSTLVNRSVLRADEEDPEDTAFYFSMRKIIALLLCIKSRATSEITANQYGYLRVF